MCIRDRYKIPIVSLIEKLILKTTINTLRIPEDYLADGTRQLYRHYTVLCTVVYIPNTTTQYTLYTIAVSYTHLDVYKRQGKVYTREAIGTGNS